MSFGKPRYRPRYNPNAYRPIPGGPQFNPTSYDGRDNKVDVPAADGRTIQLDLTKPEDFSYYVQTVFDQYGIDGGFAVRVAGKESSMNQNVGPVAEPPGGWSHGPWMLYEKGLLPDFITWAGQSGYYPNPYDPVSTTAYVAQKIAGDPTSWNNWSTAVELMNQGVFPKDMKQAAGQQDTPLDWAKFGLDQQQEGRQGTEFQQQFGLNQQQFALQGQQFQENTLQDKIAQMLTSSGQQQDVARGILSALISASPMIAPPGMSHLPGLEPYGVGQALGNRLGVNVPLAPINRMTLPISMLSGASPLSPQQIAAQYGG